MQTYLLFYSCMNLYIFLPTYLNYIFSLPVFELHKIEFYCKFLISLNIMFQSIIFVVYNYTYFHCYVVFYCGYTKIYFSSFLLMDTVCFQFLFLLLITSLCVFQYIHAQEFLLDTYLGMEFPSHGIYECSCNIVPNFLSRVLYQFTSSSRI